MSLTKMVLSPCIKKCHINTQAICIGCFRSLDEIMQWGQTTTSLQQKQQILVDAQSRAAKQ